MAENRDFMSKVGSLYKQAVAESLIFDFVNSPSFQYPSIKKLKISASYLTEMFSLDEKQMREFIIEKFVDIDNFIMHVSYMADDDVRGAEALQCVEEQALKMIDFVYSIADFPFIIVDDGKSNEFVNYTIRKAVNYLESLAESYIVVDMQRFAPSPKKSAIKINMTISDFNNNEGNYEFTVEEEKGNINLKK